MTPVDPSSLNAEPPQRAALLDELPGGVCIVDDAGELVWANARLRRYPPDVIESVRAAIASMPAVGRDGTLLKTTVGRNPCFEISVAPAGGGGARQRVALVSDITASRRLQDRLAAIDAAGRELVQLDADANARLDVPERLRLLEEKILKFSHELLAYDHLVIRVLDRRTNRLSTVVAGGLSEEAKALEILALPEGHGISGWVAATGNSYVCNDVSKDPRYLPGLEAAGATLTVPLRLNDQIVGTLNIESERVNAFEDDDRQVAEIFGRYIAIALHVLQLLVVERHTTTGQIAADVAAELAAPLNDIVGQVHRLTAAPPPPGELREQLDVILRSVERARQALTAVTEGTGVSGLAPVASAREPLLIDKRILVADDEDIIRETVAEVLTKAGAVAILARDGSEALALIAAEPFDLVLSDIKMPNKTGYEVFAAVRATAHRCPVILITGFGYDPNHSIVRASKEGLAGVLFKPFKVEQLMEEVRHALAARE